MKRVFLTVLGVIFILTGVAGIILPFLPGWVLIFFGLSLFAPHFAERVKKRIFRKLFRHEIVRLDIWNRFGVKAGFTTRHFPVHVRNARELPKKDLRLLLGSDR